MGDHGMHDAWGVVEQLAWRGKDPRFCVPAPPARPHGQINFFRSMMVVWILHVRRHQAHPEQHVRTRLQATGSYKRGIRVSIKEMRIAC